jgi:diguanylate cyclase (GGDEF)-like protein
MPELDLPTLMLAQTFVVGCAGIFLLYTGWHGRNRALLFWGTSSLYAAVGIAGYLSAALIGSPWLFVAANAAVALAGGLAWTAARIFAGMRASAAVVAAGPLGGFVLYGILKTYNLHDLAMGVELFIVSAYMFSAAVTLFPERGERLAARWPIVGLLSLHGGLLGVGGIGIVAGGFDTNALPPITSLFGLVYFETFVFALGTAVFFLAMNKERGELANKVAAHTDGLTGVANRQGFLAEAERLLNRCRAGGQDFSVVMFDLDHFKAINDAFGHSAGDEVIRRFVRVARDAMRPGDVFGRLGGEEFAAAIPGADSDTGFVRADRIRMDFAKVTFDFGDQVLMATVSGGVASDAGLPLATLLAEADAALYRAKAAGRNRIARAAVSGTEKDRKLLRIA